uniref:Uncharacterized protein n=1 Tax=Spongospora subterranea TaxID=70186 RepID=A0A0H5RF75_9EUKA|eukprot:CRZ12202.1 hypothetical protein [Spongospora subterranea]
MQPMTFPCNSGVKHNFNSVYAIMTLEVALKDELLNSCYVVIRLSQTMFPSVNYRLTFEWKNEVHEETRTVGSVLAKRERLQVQTKRRQKHFNTLWACTSS